MGVDIIRDFNHNFDVSSPIYKLSINHKEFMLKGKYLVRFIRAPQERDRYFACAINDDTFYVLFSNAYTIPWWKRIFRRIANGKSVKLNPVR